MDTTRRTILRGMAAAPIVAVAGGLSVPGAAAEEVAAGPYRLVMHVSRFEGFPGYLSWAAASDGLRHRLPAAGLERVLAAANRQGGAVGSWGDHGADGVAPQHFDHGFSWEPDGKKHDGSTKLWYPQGITSSFDGYGGPEPRSGKHVLAVTWYGRKSYAKRGARVSFIDMTDPAKPRYRHVLLVEPFQQTGHSATFKPVRMHAGGVAWVGNFLYVANRPGDDTREDDSPAEETRFRLGGLSAFDLSKMVQVSGADKKRAYDYDYVLPLHHLYANTGSRPRHSQVSLDRTQPSGQFSLVVSEYSKKAKGSAVRWNVDKATGYLTSGVSVDDWGLGLARVQGAVSVGADAYCSVNAQSRGRRGKLPGELWFHEGRKSAPTLYGTLAKGPEDLSYDENGGRGLWALGEHPNLRRVYRIKLP